MAAISGCPGAPQHIRRPLGHRVRPPVPRSNQPGRSSQDRPPERGHALPPQRRVPIHPKPDVHRHRRHDDRRDPLHRQSRDPCRGGVRHRGSPPDHPRRGALAARNLRGGIRGLSGTRRALRDRASCRPQSSAGVVDAARDGPLRPDDHEQHPPCLRPTEGRLARETGVRPAGRHRQHGRRMRRDHLAADPAGASPRPRQHSKKGCRSSSSAAMPTSRVFAAVAGRCSAGRSAGHRASVLPCIRTIVDTGGSAPTPSAARVAMSFPVKRARRTAGCTPSSPAAAFTARRRCCGSSMGCRPRTRACWMPAARFSAGCCSRG